jgi:hypothetical protein
MMFKSRLCWPGKTLMFTIMLFEPWLNSSSCRLGKLHHCSEITSGPWDASVYPTCPRTTLQYFSHED